jgi:hypothetical protein
LAKEDETNNEKDEQVYEKPESLLQVKETLRDVLRHNDTRMGLNHTH